ncbi:MAG TPA: putative porin, partial [Xanthomonadales bacterium]|nr:putative porin [Xanthomonadales bacterium]
LGAILLIVCSNQVWAADISSTEIQQLREQIRLLSERLDELERASTAPQMADQGSGAPTPTLAQQGTGQPGGTDATQDEQDLDRKINQAVDEKLEQRMQAVSWAERLRWSGDFRYRYENLAVENADDRNRNRIRARAHLSADVSETMQVGLGLATGGEDPVSTNQTIGGGGSSKPISLDLAYFEWTGLANTHVLGGKFKQQQHSAGDFGLVWDSDWRPEGTSIRYDNGRFFAVGLGTWIESDSSKAQQEFSYGVQAGLNLPLGEHTNLLLGAGYYNFDTAGKGSFFGDGDFFGNSFNPISQTYQFDYREIEGFAELGFELFDRPILLFADYVQNLEVDENDIGYALGANYGEAKRKGSWEMNYAYKRLEADAVLGLLTDSDFGVGGTDAKGSVISGAYAVHDNWNFRMTYILSETNLASDNPTDLKRLQLDLQFKYK